MDLAMQARSLQHPPGALAAAPGGVCLGAMHVLKSRFLEVTLHYLTLPLNLTY